MRVRIKSIENSDKAWRDFLAKEYPDDVYEDNDIMVYTPDLVGKEGRVTWEGPNKVLVQLDGWGGDFAFLKDDVEEI